MTEESTNNSKFKKWIIRILWVLLALLILVGALRLSLKTSVVQGWVKNKIVNTANNQLNGRLQIKSLSGDLWKEAKLDNIRIRQDEDTLVSIDSLQINYNIWALLDGKIAVSRLGIYQPAVNLRQKNNRWNVSTLVPPSTDTSSSSDPMAFQVSDLRLRGGFVSARGESVPMDSSLTITNLSLSSHLQYSKEEYAVELSGLSFKINQYITEEPVKVSTAAKANNNKITLKKLAVATGNSAIKSSGIYQPNDSLNLDLSAQPLSWKDLTNVASDIPLQKDLQISVGAKGTPQNFSLSLNAGGKGIDTLSVGTDLRWKEGLELNYAKINIAELKLPVLLGDTTLPSLQHLQTSFDGQLPIEDYQKISGKVKLDIAKLKYHSSQVDRIKLDGNIKSGKSSISLKARHRQQKLTVNADVNRIWSDSPSISTTLNTYNINPGYWLNDATYTGDVRLTANLSGTGWIPREKGWKYRITSKKSSFMQHPVSDLNINGQFNMQHATTNGRANLGGGTVQFTAHANNITNNLTYGYQFFTRDLDVAELMGRPNFNTALNTKITGNGSGTSLGTLQNNTAISVDSSLVNGELIRNFSAAVTVDDTVAKVDSASLKSTIAGGTVNGQLNLKNYYDQQNRLSLDLKIRDIAALAPLMGVDDLNAEGNFRANLQLSKDQNVTFDSNIDLSDVQYGELITSAKLSGIINADLQPKIHYDANLELQNPTISGLALNDLAFKSSGNFNANNQHADGDFGLLFSSSFEGQVVLNANYQLNSDSVFIKTTKLDLKSSYRTLSLQKPFATTVQGDTLQMDNMHIAAPDSAYMEAEIPIWTSSNKQATFKGNALNLSVIQHCVLGESLIDAQLEGDIAFSKQDTSLTSKGQLLLTNLKYKDIEFDSLRFQENIRNERLKGSLSLQQDGEELLHGKGSVPFRLADPETLPPGFFEEPVSGSLTLKSVAADRFESLLAEAGISNTSGRFKLKSKVDGKAGNPKLSINTSLRNGKLSGVSIDSVTTKVSYNHSNEELSLDASVVSLSQKAAQINATAPFYINLKSFNVHLPDQADSVEVDVSTNDFDISAVNGFLDPKEITEVAGRLDGKVHIKGPTKNLKADGKLELLEGAVRLKKAGIKLKDIGTTLQFSPDQIALNSFSAVSGKGKVNIDGTVEFNKMIPGDIDIDINAKNFTAINSDQYNAIISMDTHAGGSVQKPKVDGELDIMSGFVKLDNFGEKSVESISLDSSDTQSSVSVYDSLSLDMGVNFNPRFRIENNRYLELQAALKGDVELQKKPNKPLQLFGAITTPSGYARPFGKRFELQKGRVSFTGKPSNPDLMIRTRYEPTQTEEDVVIWYVIEGTVEKPEFKYESQPQMELQNIISYTIFGQPYYALNSWKQTVAGSGGGKGGAANAAIDVLMDRVEALATQKLGIDVVKIDNTRSGGENGTSITTGWYINPKVFFAIQNVITGSRPDTSFLLEYKLRKNLKILLRQGNGIRQGVDVRWNYDY